MEKELLFNLHLATSKCLKIAEKITCVEDIKKTLVYENLISNMLFLKDLEAKLSQLTKEKYDFIDWEKFKEYDKIIISDFHETDHATIYKIIKEELPSLFEKLEKVIFTN
ncbi:MAG: DUF86 domain-containing protein [Bacteroidales bacterium]|nr:DUF86 domain-containing protein [Bacteroidales bacterium]